MTETPLIEVRGLTIRRDETVIQQGLNFTVGRGQIFAIMGETGAGKSRLFSHMVGLEPPAEGDIYYEGDGFWSGSVETRERLMRRFGVLFSGGALFSTKTLIENVAVVLRLHTALSRDDVVAVARLKLALMGLSEYENHYPSEVDEARRTWAGFARATALGPEILFLDEPAARLDPLGARRVDAIIRWFRDDLGATVVLVSNDRESLLSLADEAIFLDSETNTMTARGTPSYLRDHATDPKVRAFLGGAPGNA